jgi:prolyl-tRNA synthetase
MNNIYADFAENFMAIPVIKGTKTESERFAGAVETYCIEALMQDGKALQAGTSHFLGQNFAKAFDVKFASKEGTQELVWASSWGVSTRLIGGLIMTHSDDQGLVLPPKLAPIQVVIVPIYKTDEQRAAVAQKAEELQSELSSKGLFVKFDNDDTKKPGWKFAEHEMKGVPVRIAIGPRDLENQTAEVARRDTGVKESISFDSIVDHSVQLMTDIQENLFQKALEFRERETREASTYEEFKEIIKKQGGFVKAHWDGTAETEERIKKETSATIRCIPLDDDVQEGKCMVTGQPSAQRVIFAKAY